MNEHTTTLGQRQGCRVVSIWLQHEHLQDQQLGSDEGVCALFSRLALLALLAGRKVGGFLCPHPVLFPASSLRPSTPMPTPALFSLV